MNVASNELGFGCVALAFRRAIVCISNVGLKANATNTCANHGRTASVERLEFDDGGAVVIAHPESDRRRGIVHEYSSDVCGMRQKIIGHLP